MSAPAAAAYAARRARTIYYLERAHANSIKLSQAFQRVHPSCTPPIKPLRVRHGPRCYARRASGLSLFRRGQCSERKHDTRGPQGAAAATPGAWPALRCELDPASCRCVHCCAFAHTFVRHQRTSEITDSSEHGSEVGVARGALCGSTFLKKGKGKKNKNCGV
jgi:hypothetical protein